MCGVAALWHALPLAVLAQGASASLPLPARCHHAAFTCVTPAAAQPPRSRRPQACSGTRRMLASTASPDPLRERYRRERAAREASLLRDAPSSAIAHEDEDETEALDETDYEQKDRNFRVRNGKLQPKCEGA